MSDGIAAALERLRRLAEAVQPAVISAESGPASGPEVFGNVQVPAASRDNGAPPPADAAAPPPASRDGSGLSLSGEISARRTACERLRRLLADGAWHSALELVDVGGLRYGGRLHEIRRGEDGAVPLDVEAEARRQGSRRVWFYRRAPFLGQVELLVVLVALGFGMLGCVGELGDAAGERCRAVCAPGLVAEVTRERCVCAPLPDGVCSIDRLVVAPVPPGPDGRERRGGRRTATTEVGR